ncbi:MAG: hypothetical protein ACYC0M_05030 [Burkholderiales bacterium]
MFENVFGSNWCKPGKNSGMVKSVRLLTASKGDFYKYCAALFEKIKAEPGLSDLEIQEFNPEGEQMENGDFGLIASWTKRFRQRFLN